MSDLSDSRIPSEVGRAAQAAQGQGLNTVREAFDKVASGEALPTVNWTHAIQQSMQDMDKYNKLQSILHDAVEALQGQIADISQRDAVACILQAITCGDFKQYVLPGEFLAQYHYKPFDDMEIMHETIKLQARKIQELEARLKFYMQPVAGDGMG